MDKSFAVVVALSVIVIAFGLSMLFLWGVTTQIIHARDRHHAELLRRNAKRLEEAGYLEAAQCFRDYAKVVEAPQAERERLTQ